MNAPAATSARPTTGQAGPPLLAPALAFAVLTVTAMLLGRGTAGPATAAAALAYYRTHTTIMRVDGLLEFAAAVPLAIWAAIVYQRLRTLVVNAPGPVIGLAGGLLAAASLSLSGLVEWVASHPADIDAPLAGVLADLAFATGGPGHVVPLALLIAGVAVPVLLVRLTNAPLAWAGLVLAAIGMISTLTLVSLSTAVTVPITRLGAVAWIVAISAVLPRHRQRTAASADGTVLR